MNIKKNTMPSIIFMLVTGVILFGQTVPELEKQLEKVAGKKKIEVLNQLSYAHRNLSAEKTLQYGNQALKLARVFRDRKGEGVALINISIGHGISGNFKVALRNAQQALEIFERLGDKSRIADVSGNIGSIYMLNGEYEKVLEFNFKALKIRETLGDKEKISASFSNIGALYSRIGIYDKSLEYQLKALKIYEEIGDKIGIGAALHNIGIIYARINQYENALKYNLESLKIKEETGDKIGTANSLSSIGIIYNDLGEKEKSLEYLFKSLKIDKEIGNKKKISNTLHNIGITYSGLKNFDKALEYYLRSLKISKENEDKENISATLINIGHIHITQRYYDKALPYLQEGLKLAQKINSNESIKECYFNFSELYTGIGDDKKALEYYKYYINQKDKIFNEKNSKQITQMQTQYDILKKEKEIEALKKDKQIQKLILERQTMVRNAAIIISLLSIIFLIQFFRRYRYLFTFWKKKSHIAHYRLLDKIGSGGMGDIYKARDIREKSRSRSSSYAIKVLKEEYYKDDKYKARFKNEAALIDQLHHPHIVKVMERGEHDGTLYIAMELLEGETLAGLLEKEKPIGLKTALVMMIQMAGALAAIHKRGIIHRDLKPENIMVTQAGDNTPFIKVLDFGLARAQNLTRLTRTGLIMGTIYYIAPEQLTRSAILPAGDIYSLGVIGYQVLTGEKPYSGDTAFGIARQILRKEPVKIEVFQPGVPAELSELVKEMMARDPGKRPSAGEVLNRLSEIEKSLSK